MHCTEFLDKPDEHARYTELVSQVSVAVSVQNYRLACLSYMRMCILLLQMCACMQHPQCTYTHTRTHTGGAYDELTSTTLATKDKQDQAMASMVSACGCVSVGMSVGVKGGRGLALVTSLQFEKQGHAFLMSAGLLKWNCSKLQFLPKLTLVLDSQISSSTIRSNKVKWHRSIRPSITCPSVLFSKPTIGIVLSSHPSYVCQVSRLAAQR